MPGFITAGVVGRPGDIHSTQQNTLGQLAFTTDGKGYVYLQGIGSVAAGSWVTIGAVHVAALLVSGANGRVAVASAAIVASKFGWFQVAGECTNALASSNGTIASGGGQLQVGGSGLVAAQGTSTGAAAGDYIFGAYAYSGQPASESTGADTIASVFLNYPFIAAAPAVASS